MAEKSRLGRWWDAFLEYGVALIPLWLFVAAGLAWAIGRLAS